MNMQPENLDNNNPLRILLDASFQGVKRLFVLAFDNTVNDNKKVERDSHKKYFLPRVTITNYSVLIDGKNIYDQPIGDQIKNVMKLDKLQQDKERFTQQDICYIINTKY